jgi:dCTP deaminase
MALLITEEAVEMPPDALGLISIRSKYKMKGLINVSGFHVDPGFRGKLIFAVYNASERDVVLSRGDKVFVIWFLNLDQPTRYFYSGRRNDQSRISSDDVESIMGQIASPAVLAQQLQELKLEFSNFRAQVMGFASIVIAPLIIGLVLGLVNYSLPRWFAPSSSPQVQIEAPIENPLLDTIDAPSGVE